MRPLPQEFKDLIILRGHRVTSTHGPVVEYGGVKACLGMGDCVFLMLHCADVPACVCVRVCVCVLCVACMYWIHGEFDMIVKAR